MINKIIIMSLKFNLNPPALKLFFLRWFTVPKPVIELPRSAQEPSSSRQATKDSITSRLEARLEELRDRRASDRTRATVGPSAPARSSTSKYLFF